MRFTLTNDALFAAYAAMRQVAEQRDFPGLLMLKVARILTALHTPFAQILAARDAVQARYALRFPTDHPTHAGRPLPVYAAHTPPERQTPDNVDAILPGQCAFAPAEAAAVRHELLELGRGTTDVECPALTEAEVALFTLAPSMMMALLWLVPDAE